MYILKMAPTYSYHKIELQLSHLSPNHNSELHPNCNVNVVSKRFSKLCIPKLFPNYKSRNAPRRGLTRDERSIVILILVGADNADE